MFDDPLFFPAPILCKHADIEQINNKVSKKICVKKSRPGFYIHVAWEACNLGFKGLLHVNQYLFFVSHNIF